MSKAKPKRGPPRDKILGLVLPRIMREPFATCLAQGPACAQAPIASHSIQNSVVLTSLADEGHVSMISVFEDAFTFKEVGRRLATTFTGFCAAHDASVFSEVDYRAIEDVDPASPGQCAQHFLRAISIELWKKKNIVAGFRAIETRNDAFLNLCRKFSINPDIFTFNPEFVEPYLEGTSKGIQELQEHFDELRRLIATRNFEGQLISVSRIVRRQANFATVSAASPTQDLSGSLLYDPKKMVIKVQPMPHMAIAVLPHREGCAVIGSVLRRSRFRLEPLLNQFGSLAGGDFEIGISKFVLNHCENIVFKPSLIRALGAPAQTKITKVFRESMFEALLPAKMPDINLFRLN